jgi:hypothetical protein
VLYRREQARLGDIAALVPDSAESLLDAGAREGKLAGMLVDRFKRVVALDLNPPVPRDARVESVAGDITALGYGDDAFDVVVCSEVLEHIPIGKLSGACRELCRVARSSVVVGVPYRQDLRCARTLCGNCHRRNPAYGHVNSFTEEDLISLFPECVPVALSYVGSSRERTNPVSSALMDFAGNPYGTYDQDECCVHCGARILPPGPRTFVQRIATRAAVMLDRVQRALTPTQARWLHMRFDKSGERSAKPAIRRVHVA